MHITLVDDSLSFDGYAPATRPLGGAEKAFASLPGALARRGHDVHVYNRARFPLTIEDARWETLDASFPAQTDVLIAFRKPSLLSSMRMAGQRVLWVTASARQLEPARKALDSFKPALVFQGVAQAAGWRDIAGVPAWIIPPGLRDDFTGEQPTELAEPPLAVVTTHPAHGLSWLLDLWVSAIRPLAPTARLAVVSAGLHKGQQGGEVTEDLQPVLEQAVAATAHGVEIIAPMGDPGMAGLYRSARVHLYPGHQDDLACWTLMESQACGLPAVARPLGAARERIRDGMTGQVVPDDAAFANVAARLLTDDGTFWGMSRDARLLQKDRSWDMVAAEFEAVFKAEKTA